MVDNHLICSLESLEIEEKDRNTNGRGDDSDGQEGHQPFDILPEEVSNHAMKYLNCLGLIHNL